MSVPLVRISNATKIFPGPNGDIQALADVSLDIEKGMVFGILGRSGAGKSTLIRLINGLEKPTSGRVLVGGTDLASLSPSGLKLVRKKTGMIFQHFNLAKTLTVRENVQLPLRLHGVPGAEAKSRAEKFLSLVGLSDKATAYPAQLSGGQKQRVAIARALALEPDILLSDEATSALDPETKESILDLLGKINRELGITIVLITHELGVVQKICHRCAVMDSGRIVEEGPVFDIFTGPKASLTRSFIKGHFHEHVLPKVLAATTAPGSFVRLSYTGSASVKPALALATRKFRVVPNILSGLITELGDEPYGRLTIHLEGDDDEVSMAIAFLRAEGVGVEEVTYDELS